MSLQTGVIRLALQAFRSYAAYEWSTDRPQAIALIGPNGAGKTNFLEALSLLTPGRGLKRASTRDVQADHETNRPWAIAATIQTPTGPLDVRTARLSLDSERRVTTISGVPLKTQKELSHYLYALWLTPQMDGLFREAESARRRFLDRLVLGFFAEHGTHVSAYEKALRERHRLFETAGTPPSWLDGLEKIMACEGVEIIQKRLSFLDQLEVQLQENKGPFPKAHLRLEGELETQIQKEGTIAAQHFFQEWLKTQRFDHQRTGQTPMGAHKSRLKACFPGSIAADQCSTGQQKILLMSIILAACQLHTQQKTEGRCFLLLLDDVMAHLDARHREAFLESLAPLPFQVWMTGTEEEMLRPARAEIVFLN